MDCKKTRPIVSYPQEGVCPPFTFQHGDRGFPLHSGNWILSMLSRWERSSFCHCSFLPTGTCGRCSCTWLSVAPSSSQLRRLRLPVPLTARACPCRRAFDPPGDHRAACPRSGAPQSRCTPLERAAARVCSEAGARVITHTLTSNFNIPTIQRIDNRRIEVIAHGFISLGRKPVGHWHHHRFPPHQPSSTPATQRTTRKRGTTGCAKVQRTDVPRTCPSSSLPPGRFWSWSRTPLEWRSSRVHPQLAKARARQSPDPLRQAVTAALIARWSAFLAHATFTAVAASLLCEDNSFHNNVDGLPPSRTSIWNGGGTPSA